MCSPFHVWHAICSILGLFGLGSLQYLPLGKKSFADVPPVRLRCVLPRVGGEAMEAAALAVTYREPRCRRSDHKPSMATSNGQILDRVGGQTAGSFST